MQKTPILAALLAALLAAACAHAPRVAPPAADFLLVAGDSTYWVTTGPAGVKVRASGLMLAKYSGRFHEIFIADDDHSYDDALLVGQDVYSRDLLSGDSTRVFVDTLVGRLAREYASAHPDETPLPADDPGPDNPSTAATSDVSFLDVHGPFLSLEYRARTRKRGATGLHTTWHAVVDLRSASVGQRSLADVIGPEAATRAVADGRRMFTHAIDSVRTAAKQMPARAARALNRMQFDERSFALADTNGAPAVEFAARVTGSESGGAMLMLPRIAVPVPPWWADIRATLPGTATDDTARWSRAHYTVVAVADSTGEMAQVALLDSASHRWAVRTVPAPVQHVFWLDSPRADSATRAGLRRAFDEAALYDGQGSIASVEAGGGAPRLHEASAPQPSRAKPFRLASLFHFRRPVKAHKPAPAHRSRSSL